ncbi:Similar to phosphoglycolate phosphatase, clustered with ubiquinone biosynthesis SAM-dependent O-methyltransferase [hydrothermal vent metagenome]|uniref:Similar to phosphoglycolate phosphatase, clustered with ubiquinone biosynthesis SAM-dependent O-methyltransferase n=1 Tax=hydrothermal vent metagenome TaxID=652676 RepID=A0A3B0VL61_9ZZZZ
MSINCILFDLDGTLLDTSYDFAYALNQTCRDFNSPPLRYQALRQTVSQGGLAMIQLAFPTLKGEELNIRKEHFLNLYFENIDHHTHIFSGLERGLQVLAEQQIPWGIVTNKPTWLTEKLLQNIHFPSPPNSVVCGDTLTVNKPNPAPLHLAAKQCHIDSKNCLYIGDHRRDIEAGINAGMQTAGAMFGYLTDDDYDNPWPTKLFFETPYEMSQYFQHTFSK